MTTQPDSGSSLATSGVSETVRAELHARVQAAASELSFSERTNLADACLAWLEVNAGSTQFSEEDSIHVARAAVAIQMHAAPGCVEEREAEALRLERDLREELRQRAIESEDISEELRTQFVELLERGRLPTTEKATRKRILVVDDDVNVLASLGRLLEILDADVDTVSDPLKALDRMEEDNYDLVISDERMPGLSGSDLLSKVRADSPRTPTILMTAYGDANAVERAYTSCGVFRYLTKPWDNFELVVTVREALRAAENL